MERDSKNIKFDPTQEYGRGYEALSGNDEWLREKVLSDAKSVVPRRFWDGIQLWYRVWLGPDNPQRQMCWFWSLKHLNRGYIGTRGAWRYMPHWGDFCWRPRLGRRPKWPKK